VATTLYYTFTDQLGTPILQTDGSANIVWRAEHEPYGNVWKMRTGSRTDQPLRLPGQDLSMTWEGAEENYNVFRWYRAGWGRYTQADPLAVLGRSSRAAIEIFTYGRDNPTTTIDPLGLYTTSGGCDGKLCGPPSDSLCASNPRSTVCIAYLYGKLRHRIRSSSQCRAALNSFGSGFGADDVIRATFPGTPGPRMTCDARDCDSSSFGGYRQPHYNPFTGAIPVCFSLYDGNNSLLHELLHWFGVPDNSSQQRVLLKTCFPEDEP
jgi:RHS repeat-associated protein